MGRCQQKINSAVSAISPPTSYLFVSLRNVYDAFNRKHIRILGNYVPASDNRSAIEASHKQLGFIADLTKLSSEDALLFHFLDVLREAGSIDMCQAFHLIDALKKPVVLLGGEVPDVFSPHDLPPKSATLLRAVLRAEGDREFVPKDSVKRAHDRLAPSNDLSFRTLGTMLKSLSQRRSLVALTHDAINPSGRVLGAVHVRLAGRFVGFLEEKGIRIEDLEKVEKR